jgi:hypothetical protein
MCSSPTSPKVQVTSPPQVLLAYLATAGAILLSWPSSQPTCARCRSRQSSSTSSMAAGTARQLVLRHRAFVLHPPWLLAPPSSTTELRSDLHGAQVDQEAAHHQLLGPCLGAAMFSELAALHRRGTEPPRPPSRSSSWRIPQSVSLFFLPLPPVFLFHFMIVVKS